MTDTVSPQLTNVERKILDFLIANRYKTVSRREIFANVYGDGLMESNVIDAHIKNMRRKLSGIEDIKTIRGKGYQI